VSDTVTAFEWQGELLYTTDVMKTTIRKQYLKNTILLFKKFGALPGTLFGLFSTFQFTIFIHYSSLEIYSGHWQAAPSIW
jgi:hypothetical protein